MLLDLAAVFFVDARYSVEVFDKLRENGLFWVINFIERAHRILDVTLKISFFCGPCGDLIVVLL